MLRDITEFFFPCAGTVGMFVVVFGFIVLMRYIGYRETLALAEKGLVKPERRTGNGILAWGISLTAVGLALCIGLYPIGFVTGNRFPLGFGPWLLAGLLPMFFGLGLILIYVLTREPNLPADEAIEAPPVAPLPPAPVLNEEPFAPPASPAPPAPPVDAPATASERRRRTK